MKSEEDGRSRDGYMEETDGGGKGRQRRVKVLLAGRPHDVSRGDGRHACLLLQG